MKEGLITVLQNKVSIKFDKVVASWNSKHARATNDLTPIWLTRMGSCDGITNKKVSEEKPDLYDTKPFVVVEIYCKEVLVFTAKHEFEKKATVKQERGGCEVLWNKFVDHSQAMAMLKFQAFADTEMNDSDKPEKPKKLNLIKP